MSKAQHQGGIGVRTRGQPTGLHPVRGIIPGWANGDQLDTGFDRILDQFVQSVKSCTAGSDLPIFRVKAAKGHQ